MKGLNLEADPRRLPRGEHPQFRALTVRSGAMLPRRGPVAYVPEVDSLEEWILGKVGSAAFAQVPYGETTKTVFADDADRVPKTRDADGTERPLAIEAPATAPSLAQVQRTLGDGLIPGETRTYAAAWLLDGVSTEPGETVELEQTAYRVNYTTGNGTQPVLGETMTSGAKSAVVQQVQVGSGTWAGGDAVGTIVLDEGDLFADLDSLTFSGGATATASSDEIALENAILALSEPSGAPADADGWVLYALDDAGYYHRLDDAALGATIRDLSSAADLLALPTYAGPLDNDYVPETLLAPTAADGFVAHKRCLFLWDGALVRYSEGDAPRQFRENATLHFGANVLAMVSRGEVVEVYTSAGMRYIVGEPGLFEYRETQIGESIVNRASLWPTEKATAAVFPDGLYQVTTPKRASLTVNQATPWFEAITDPDGVVVGASEGIFYVADGTRCLALDWEAREFFDLELPAAASGFYWSAVQKALVLVTAGAYYLMEQGTDPVEFALQGPTMGDPSQFLPLPAALLVLAKGPMTLEVYGEFYDGEESDAELLYQDVLIQGVTRYPLPAEAVQSWFWVLTGSGTRDTHKIVAVEVEK